MYKDLIKVFNELRSESKCDLMLSIYFDEKTSRYVFRFSKNAGGRCETELSLELLYSGLDEMITDRLKKTIIFGKKEGVL